MVVCNINKNQFGEIILTLKYSYGNSPKTLEFTITRNEVKYLKDSNYLDSKLNCILDKIDTYECKSAFINQLNKIRQNILKLLE